MPQVEYYYSSQIMGDRKKDQMRGRLGVREVWRYKESPLQLHFIRLAGRHLKNNPNSNLLRQWKLKEKGLLWM